MGLVVAACGTTGSGTAGVPTVNASVSSEAAAVGNAAKTALAEFQADPGGKHIETAAKKCDPLKGDQLTTVVLVSYKQVPKAQRFTWVQSWASIVKYITGPKGNRGANWTTFKECMLNQLHFQGDQKQKMTDCLGQNTFKGGFPSSMTAIQEYVTKTFLSCYDTATGLKATTTASPSSSGTGNNSPPTNPATAKPTASASGA